MFYVDLLATLYVEDKYDGRPTSHRGGPGSSPGQVILDLLWATGTGAGFLRVFRFPLPSLISRSAPHS
jgi:hypothetical protein